MRKSIFIIAEAGVNHNGKLLAAKKLVDSAQRAGADAVKFQMFHTEDMTARHAPKAAYQKNKSTGVTQFDMLKELELSEKDFKRLYTYCARKKILFLATPFDLKSAANLHRLGVRIFKIGSGDLTNLPLLKKIASYHKPIILSTGMSTLNEVKEAVKTVYSTGNKKITLLHCTSNYPARYADVNLRAMATLGRKFNVPVGYSDHTLGNEIAIAAAGLGACVIEKHITLNKKLKGPDHRSSIEHNELVDLVRSIRNVEKSLGSGVKNPVQAERAMRKVARKSIISVCDIAAGTTITERMIAIKRPGTGIAPKYADKIVGSKAKVHIKKDQILLWRHI